MLVLMFSIKAIPSAGLWLASFDFYSGVVLWQPFKCEFI